MSTTTPRLVTPSLEWEAAFLDLCAEFDQAGERFVRLTQPDFAAHLRHLEASARGEGLAPGVVPQQNYWLVDDARRIIGESRLRLALTPALEAEGGHIGYAIRPSRRRQGYGTRILALTLQKAREHGLGRVLVTCDTDNRGSARVIEKNGGVLESYAISQRSGKQISRYWIALR